MKKFFTVLLTFTLYFNLFTSAHASTVGGWTLGNGVAQGASTIYNGAKNVLINGKDYVKKGTVKITPTAANVARTLAKGIAGVALSVAVEQLLGSVDWVLDPANNQIRYREKFNPDPRADEYDWSTDGGVTYYPTVGQALKAKQDVMGPKYKCELTTKWYPAWTCYYNDGSYRQGEFYDSNTMPNRPKSEPVEQQEKTIPLATVAAQVISNAESNTDKRVAAQVATSAAAADIVAEAETDNVKARPIVNQLEQSSSTENTDANAQADSNTATGEQTKNPDKADTTDLKLTFPVFCGWAPIVCEAAQTVISFPTTLTDWWDTGKTTAEDWAQSISEAWTSAKEWAKSEKQDDTELNIPDTPPVDIDTNIAFGGNCPPDREAQINMGVGVIKIPISYEPICTTVSTAKPVLILVGFFVAALIVGGVKTE